MKRRIVAGLGLVAIGALAAGGVFLREPQDVRPDPVQETREAPDRADLARKLADTLLIADAHVDLPSRLLRKWEDLTVRGTRGEFDYVRAREGGLDLVFLSIYVPSRLEGRAEAARHADRQIALVRRAGETWPDAFVMVQSTAEVEKHRRGGRVMLAMGMENGAPINGDLAAVSRYHARGIRYITLAHARWNHLADASYDRVRRWNGLSPFGRDVVAEMNRVGIIVDVSHLTDSALVDVLGAARAPVIASHSSCRAFTPGFERNLDDNGIRAIAAGGGVIQINFGSSFLRNDIRLEEEHRERIRNSSRPPGTNPTGRRFASVSDVADHIDHVVRIAGIDHVGFGSDFEGLGDTLPAGLKDVSGYPNLLEELLRRGYTRDDLARICSGNLLRVWRAVEAVAREMGEVR